MRDLLERATRRGIVVVHADLPAGMLGCYIPSQRRICLTRGLTPIEQRSVLAHELGHAHHGHGACAPRGTDQAESWERQADAYAARLLIDHEDYARAERWSSDAETMAEELGVTKDVLEAYRALCLTRVRGGVYAPSRFGGAQA